MPEETRRILTQIGIYLGIMIFSYVFALVEVNSRARKKVAAAEGQVKSAQKAQAAAEAKLKEVQDFLQAKSAELNLLRLWLDPARAPQLELDGTAVDPRSLSAEQRRRLIAIITQMRPWLEGSSATASFTPAPAPVQAPGAVRPASPAAAPPPAEEEAAPAQLSLARQIDSVLQARLANTPLAARGIRIRDLLSGGVEFVVDGRAYAGVEEIPDPQVQAAVKAAIAEWERKMG